MSQDVLSLVRPLLENADTLNLPTEEITTYLALPEIAFIRQLWQAARDIADHFTYDATRDAERIPVALAMPEWVDPYVRRVVAQYPDNHLLKRLLLQQSTLEDIRIANKTIPNPTPGISHTDTIETTLIPIIEPAGYYLVYSNGEGIHRATALWGTPLYASNVDALDLWTIVKAFPRQHYAVILSGSEQNLPLRFNVEIHARSIST